MPNDRLERRREQYRQFRHPESFVGEQGLSRRYEATQQRQQAARLSRIAHSRNPASQHAEHDRRAHEHMMQNPLYRELAGEALRGGSIAVLTRDNQPRPGMWNAVTRTLSMHSTLTGSDRASVMAFELNNAVHSSARDRLAERAVHSQIGREEFAREGEFYEYEGVMNHHRIMQHGIAHHGWPASMDRFGARFGDHYMDISPPASPARGDWRTFEGYWQSQNRVHDGQVSHTDVHRQSYDAAQRAGAILRRYQGRAPGPHAQGSHRPSGGGSGS